MRIAVCCSENQEARRLCLLTQECAAAEGKRAETVVFGTEEELWQSFRPGCFQGAVVGYGDVRGFLCARRLREEDPACRVILLDDTERYAIRGLRIHLSDFLFRPCEDARLQAALARLMSD